MKVVWTGFLFLFFPFYNEDIHENISLYQGVITFKLILISRGLIAAVQLLIQGRCVRLCLSTKAALG